MSTSEQEFLDELRKTFTFEAGEHLQTIASGLVEIEKKKDPAERQAVTESIYRAAHNLKGAARAVNLSGIGLVCQAMENVFSAMKKGLLTLAAEDFDILQRVGDSIVRILVSPTGEPDADSRALIEQLNRIAAPEKKVPPQELAEPARGAAAPLPRGQDNAPSSAPSLVAPAAVATGRTAADTIRIATSKLDAILLQTEELISIKLSDEQHIAELTEVTAVFDSWKKKWEKGHAARRIGGKRETDAPKRLSTSRMPLLPDSSDVSFARMCDLDSRLNGLLLALRVDRRATGLLIDQLVEGAKSVLLQPFSSMLQTFPKMVRDISREQGKEVDLVLAGGEIEIDKRILERMKDPLIHLLRNAIDHGIEKPDARRARGKSSGGTIIVEVSQAEGNLVRILVSDDGAGIDAAKLRESAVTRGYLPRAAADALDDQAAMMLIFISGVSTSTLITDLSGRGLGMAIARDAVDKLGGKIAVDTSKRGGTTFRISLPLTLATFHGVLLREYGRLFAVPTASVERVLRVKLEDVRTVENRETILVDGTPLSMVRLGAVLGLAPTADGVEVRPMLSVIILAVGEKRIAFTFDRLLYEQEILIKGLGAQLPRVRNIAGATILGSGKLVPVLNVADLLKSAVRAGQTVVAPRAAIAPPRQTILVVEDSITSRMLLKSILSSAGFDVHTVVDGDEAWMALKERDFHAVVSDIEMPRMNGFDLTAKIRADAKLAALPVVLLTSLESRSDRERGLEVGADAYIAKSSFDQSNLLDVVRRLL